MKKSIILFFSVAPFSFFGCTDVSLLDFDLNVKTALLRIEPTTTADTTYSITSEVLSLSDELEKNKINADQIKELTLKELQLTLIEPVDGDFDWMDSCSVLLLEEGKEDIVLAEIPVVLRKKNFLTVGNVDRICEVISLETSRIRLQGTTSQEIKDVQKIEVGLVFKAKI